MNPFGPPKIIKKTLRELNVSKINRYPPSKADQVRKKIAHNQDLNPNNVIVTAGISELIDIIGKTFINSNRTVLVPEYTYGEYEPVSEINKGDIKKIPMPNLELKKSKILKKIEKNSIVFLCNPNNPTGKYLDFDTLKKILSQIKEKNSLLIIDEAYIGFLKNNKNLKPLLGNNLILMRSFTKTFGIPGIRIGYGLSSSKNIENLLKTKTPWNVSTLGQKAALKLESEKGKNFLRKTKEKIIKNRKKLIRELKELGFKVKKSRTNFLLVRVSEGKEIRKKLLKRGIIVRDCASFGLPKFIRISILKEKQNKKLLNNLKEIKQE